MLYVLLSADFLLEAGGFCKLAVTGELLPPTPVCSPQPTAFYPGLALNPNPGAAPQSPQVWLRGLAARPCSPSSSTAFSKEAGGKLWTQPPLCSRPGSSHSRLPRTQHVPFAQSPPAHASYLPDLVMIISVPSSWNLSQSSFVSRLQAILAISSLGMMGVVGIRGSVHREDEEGLLPPPPNSAWASRLVSSPRGWAQDDFSTNCSGDNEKEDWLPTLAKKGTLLLEGVGQGTWI